MEEEDRSLDPMSVAEFERETEEILSKAGVDIPIVDETASKPKTSCSNHLVEESVEGAPGNDDSFKTNDLNIPDLDKNACFDSMDLPEAEDFGLDLGLAATDVGNPEEMEVDAKSDDDGIKAHEDEDEGTVEARTEEEETKADEDETKSDEEETKSDEDEAKTDEDEAHVDQTEAKLGEDETKADDEPEVDEDESKADEEASKTDKEEITELELDENIPKIDDDESKLDETVANTLSKEVANVSPTDLDEEDSNAMETSEIDADKPESSIEPEIIEDSLEKVDENLSTEDSQENQVTSNVDIPEMDISADLVEDKDENDSLEKNAEDDKTEDNDKSDCNSVDNTSSQSINDKSKKNSSKSNVEDKCENGPLQSSEIDTSCINDETEFVQVNTKGDKISSTENESQYDMIDISTDEDPIGGTENIEFENGDLDADDETIISDKPAESADKGDDEEVCIIPDTDRVISQAEKEAAMNKNDVIDISADDSNDKSKDDEVVPVQSKEVEASESSDVPVEASEVDSSKTPNVINLDEPLETICKECDKETKCQFKVTHQDLVFYICSNDCLDPFLKKNEPEPESTETESKKPQLKCKTFRSIIANLEPLVFVRKCMTCQKKIIPDRSLNWECMEFCNEDCIGKFQINIGGNCASCTQPVVVPSLGKYCVRFGNDIRQFCSSGCLEEFKKGLKVCSYCQKNISKEQDGFLAPVGDTGQFKDFCTQSCMRKFEIMSTNQTPEKPHSTCSVCNNKKPVRLEIIVGDEEFQLCSEPCFVAFKFANNVSPEQCRLCHKYFEQTTLDNTIFFDDEIHTFCSRTCQNVYIIASRKIVPCQWCKVKKYNFDMIKKTMQKQTLMMCSVNCMAQHQDSLSAVTYKATKCDFCSNLNPIQYHLAMSDASIRNFCSYNCVMYFQKNFQKMPLTVIDKPVKAVPMGVPKKTYMVRETRSTTGSPTTQTTNDVVNFGVVNTSNAKLPMMPIITNVHSLAHTNGATPNTRNTPKSGSTSNYSASKTANSVVQTVSSTTHSTPLVIQQVLTKPNLPVYKNKSTLCKPNTHTKGVLFRPHTVIKETQTEEVTSTVVLPVPVPIYIPVPMAMYSMPVPVPVPFPLPIPIPIFIPTTRNSANGIMKEIKKIQVKIPTDPFEAELLMMAEMVAGEKKIDNTDSESEDDDNGESGAGDADFSPETVVDTSNAFGDDMLQMALKMATELDEPAVDLEGALTANTITANQSHDGTNDEVVDENQSLPIHSRGATPRQRKRPGRPPRSASGNGKRRRMSGSELPLITPAQAPQAAIVSDPIEKPDANMCLKYTFGVNAWKQWVTTKNAELEKSTLRVKPFKSEILQLTSDELNYSLCLFVKEVRKPNGSEYAPDTIYYLCLGIQQYLFENGRIDNIFTDAFYEKFTDCLDEVARKFSVLYNDSHYIVTRVEEEHLWESKQLGAHSPHVLLSTLMFFNTKHFNLTTVDEHMQLSFTHIMKHWKRNPNQPGASKQPGSRNVLLRFYPPQAAMDANARKKKVYEQQENEENPLRCPVKLYEFYLSKCPESVKIRNDVFYLLPERSCVPDSPVWYSTMPLGRAALEKMLHRVKMVKEINVALLTS